jgi:hypothetical protein
MGQLIKFNHACRSTIVSAISTGASYEQSARIGGITARTLSRWLTRGDYEASCGSDSDFALFSRDFREAESKVLQLVEHNVLKASNDDWRAARFILSSRVPEVYGREPAVLGRKIVDAILARIHERCSAAEYDIFCAALDDPIEAGNG